MRIVPGIVFLLSLSSFAQQSANAPLTTFRSSTELVLVPTVVVGGSGKHLEHLKKEQFTLLEDKQQQNVAFFEEVQPSSPVERPHPERVFTNYVPDDDTKRLAIFALDLVNTPYVGQAEARRVLLNVLSSVVDDGQPKALVVFTEDGIRVVHDFTTDPKTLASALRAVIARPAGAFVPGRSGADRTTDRLSSFSQPDKNHTGNDFRDRFVRVSTEKCLREIAAAFSGVPGRKALLWVTAGFPYLSASPRSVSSYAPDYERTFKSLNAANIAVYPIDVRDMAIPGFADATKRTRTDEASWRTIAPVYGRTPYMDVYQQNALQEQNTATLINFAGATGGKACIGRLDLTSCFRDALDDSHSYYMLGFYVNHSSAKTGWHKLQVKVDVPGAKVRARSGFNISDQVLKVDLRAELDAAVLSPLDYTAIPVSAKLLSQEGLGKGPSKVSFDLLLPAKAFQFEDGNSGQVDLEVIAVLRKPDGVAVVLKDQELSSQIEQEDIQKIKTAGFVRHEMLEIPEGGEDLRILVRNNVSGKIGSVSLPLNAP